MRLAPSGLTSRRSEVKLQKQHGIGRGVEILVIQADVDIRTSDLKNSTP